MPQRRNSNKIYQLLICAVFLLSVSFSWAENQTQQPTASTPEVTTPKPVTTGNPKVPVEYLELLLDPLTKDELLIEAEAWRDLVKATAAKISVREIATREKANEIALAKTESAEATKMKQKQNYMDSLNDLRESKTALLERLSKVLDNYELKGGDGDDFRKYAKAVAGIKVEVTDTNATWSAIQGWAKSKEGGIKWGLGTLKFLGILLMFWILAVMSGKVVQNATGRSEKMSGLLKNFLNITVRRLILFIGLLVALSTMNVNVGAVLALVGGGAFILGFALQDALGNFAAGIMLLLYHPFDVGDIVEVGGVNGKVDNVSLVTTTIRTFDNKIVLVPNKEVWGQVITNSTASNSRRVDMVFGISYDDDIDKAQLILMDIVNKHPMVLKEPEVVVELHTLGESSVDFVCRPWVVTENYWRVYWDVTKQVKKAFDAAEITIPYPQRDLHIYKQETAE